MAPGTVVGGKYLLSRLLGQGAMGEVWAATNASTGGEVALKLLSRPREELRHRLLREARACGKLRHRNVIDVYDVGETADGEPFLVMALLTGETLADLLARQRRLDPRHAAQIARDVARALSAAHKAGIVHRDLKPANVFLHREEGADDIVVKVLDFGVSKDLERSDGLVTVAGATVGSPAYMSPEQARIARDLDHRTDLWSLGVVLFEMLTGKRPFEGDAHQVLAKIALGPIPLISHYVRNANPALGALVGKCLEREPDQRFSSAEELAVALDRFARPSVPAPPPSLPGPAREPMPSLTSAPPVSARSGAPDSDNDMPTLRWHREAMRAMLSPNPGSRPGAETASQVDTSAPTLPDNHEAMRAPVYARTVTLSAYPNGVPSAPRFGTPPPLPATAGAPPSRPNAPPSSGPAPDKALHGTVRLGPESSPIRAPSPSSALSSMAPLVHPSTAPAPFAALRSRFAHVPGMLLTNRYLQIGALAVIGCVSIALISVAVIRAHHPVPAKQSDPADIAPPLPAAPPENQVAPPAPEPSTPPATPTDDTAPAPAPPAVSPPATPAVTPSSKPSSKAKQPPAAPPSRKNEAPKPAAPASKSSTLQNIQQALNGRGK
ncbi:MAG: protein kinase [Minicystis sp.]